MNANVQHPLAQLQAAEAKLIGTLTAATARVNGIADEQRRNRPGDLPRRLPGRLDTAGWFGVAVRALAGEVFTELASVSERDRRRPCWC